MGASQRGRSAPQGGEAESSRGPGDWAHGHDDRELRPHRVLEGAVDGSGSFERAETDARAHRLRKMLLWGGLAYLSFLPTDLTFNWMRGEGHGLVFVGARLLGALPIAAMWLRLRRGPVPRQRTLMLMEAVASSVVAIVTAVMALLSGGMSSPVVAGLLPILVVRGMSIPDPWRRGLMITAAPALSFWAVLLGGCVLRPELGDFSDTGIANLILHLGLVGTTVAMITLGNHIRWDLRRSLFRARRVGRYELRRPLGRGAMGEVWAAWHQGLRQEVALKILPLHRGGGPGQGDAGGAVSRFEREVMATTKLRHPNTVRVYDFGFSPDGFWFYAMELLEGETVAELVARAGPLTVERALQLIRQAARALSEAHGHGIVHRDIKPENLFVSRPAGERDVLKVLDFGVASVAAEASQYEEGATEPMRCGELHGQNPTTDQGLGPEFAESDEAPGRAVGTPLYISPEVARGRRADPRSDIYGLGCVLYFMLAGRPVFVGKDARSLLRAHVERKPRPPSELLAHPLPDYVDRLILRCLEKDPERRFPDALALVRALDLCLRLGANDRRRGAGETQPRLRAGQAKIEEWAAQSRTETDMSLVMSDEQEDQG